MHKLLHQRRDGEAKSSNNLLPGKINDIICPSYRWGSCTVDTSNLMAIGTCLKDLNSYTDIATTRLLTVDVSLGVPLLRLA